MEDKSSAVAESGSALHGAPSASEPSAALARALAVYDATPRMESKYRPAFEALRAAAQRAGMPTHCNAVVAWARSQS